MNARRALSSLAALCIAVAPTMAADIVAGPDDYLAQLPRLVAGDHLRLVAGDYRRGLPLHDLAGRADAPIIIEGDGGARPRFLARRGANTVSLVNVRHVVIRNLELDGQHLPVDGVKAEGHGDFADFVTLADLYIHDHDASQQNVGISTKCPAHGWVIRGNRIERVGTGLYLGDSDGGKPFVAGVIEGNQVRDTVGYNLQIKHQKSRPGDGTARFQTIIRHNVFAKAGATPGPNARPNVLLGHFPPTGAGSEDRYLVYGNLFLHNPSEALLQAEGRVAIYDNVFVNGSGDAIHIQPHNDVPRDMDIFSNTVLASGTGIRVRQAEGAPYRQRVRYNVVAASVPLSGGDALDNVTLPYQADLVTTPAAALTGRLLARARTAQRPEAAAPDAPGVYPDWPKRNHPGARFPHALEAVGE